MRSKIIPLILCMSLLSACGIQDPEAAENSSSESTTTATESAAEAASPDSENRLIRQKNANDRLLYHENRYEYDENGNMIHEIFILANLDLIHSEVICTYDEIGRKLTNTDVYGDVKISSNYEYVYFD